MNVEFSNLNRTHFCSTGDNQSYDRESMYLIISLFLSVIISFIDLNEKVFNMIQPLCLRPITSLYFQIAYQSNPRAWHIISHNTGSPFMFLVHCFAKVSTITTEWWRFGTEKNGSSEFTYQWTHSLKVGSLGLGASGSVIICKTETTHM